MLPAPFPAQDFYSKIAAGDGGLSVPAMKCTEKSLSLI
jgi:hypothetical protein